MTPNGKMSEFSREKNSNDLLCRKSLVGPAGMAQKYGGGQVRGLYDRGVIRKKKCKAILRCYTSILPDINSLQACQLAHIGACELVCERIPTASFPPWSPGLQRARPPLHPCCCRHPHLLQSRLLCRKGLSTNKEDEEEDILINDDRALIVSESLASLEQF